MRALRVEKRLLAQKALNTPSILHLGAFIWSVLHAAKASVNSTYKIHVPIKNLVVGP